MVARRLVRHILLAAANHFCTVLPQSLRSGLLLSNEQLQLFFVRLELPALGGHLSLQGLPLPIEITLAAFDFLLPAERGSLLPRLLRQGQAQRPGEHALRPDIDVLQLNAEIG